MSWNKWHHDKVPNEEGKEREKIRKKLAQLGHCKTCTVLSGCYFVSGNTPDYPQHLHCDCLLWPIAVANDELTAYCDITKFTEYIFRYDKSKGKTYVFEEWGFHIGDSEYLKEELERQAKAKYANGDYTLGVLDEYGQRITIIITLQDKQKNVRIFKTGWMVRPLGRITCNTPFTGGAK